MKVLFINPNTTGQEYILLGIAYLSSYIKSKGHKTYLFNFTFREGNLTQQIAKIKPNVICFSFNSGEYKFSVKIAENIKKHFNIPIIFGGVHTTIAPEETIKNKCVDMICIGEGEEALAELLEKIENRKPYLKTKNFWFKKDGKIIKNSLRPLIQDLDKLPFPDRELFNYQRYIKITNKLTLMSGRGCPFKCAYCQNHTLQKLYPNQKYARKRTVENVLKEIQYMINRYKKDIKGIYFSDETFTIDKSWTLEFCKKYKKRFNLKFICRVRPGTANKEILKALKNAGCERIQVGVEEGNEKLRINILNRNITDKQIIEIFRIANKIGLNIYSYNIIGSPFQTKEDYWKLVELNRKLKPTYLLAQIFQPYKETDMYRLCKEKGWITNKEHPKHQRTISIMNYPYITRREIKWNRKLFRFRVFRKHNLIKGIILLMTDLNYTTFTKIRRRLPIKMRNILWKINSWTSTL